MMITRYFSSAALGLLVAIGLLWLMQFLIDIGPEAFVEKPRKIQLSWLPERKPEVIEDQQEPPHRPPPPIDSPPDHRLPGEGDDIPWVGPPATAVPEDPAREWDIPAIRMTDGPLAAMMSVRPVYPLRATSLGLEGHVVVRFDVDELGAVSNVAVVESSHRLFERAAIEAAKRSKFRPRVVNGVAVVTTGVRKLYTFELEK